MRILTVIPISRGISKDTLTYFTKKDIRTGSIVSVPLRKKKVYGLVVGNKEATEIKSELKSLSYSIKKIDSIESRTFLSNSFVEASKKIADYSASSVGAVLSVLIPKVVLEGSADSTHASKFPKEIPLGTGGTFHETLLLQSDDEERYATYRSLVREEFAKNRSVFFCLPTTEDLLNSKSILEKGIENYTYILHSGLSKKDILFLWKEITENPHPVLIVATGPFISIPRVDLGTIILEKESSRGYKMQSQPFLDIRKSAEIIAKELNIRLVLGDTLLRVETLWEEKNPTKNSLYSELAPLKFRTLSTATSEIKDMHAPQNMKKKEFAIFSDNAKDLIRNAKENNEHTFLFCGRKGLYPITVCSDCGTVVVCNNCKAPVVLYGPSSRAELTTGQGRKSGQNKNLFVCHHCGERRDAQELCSHCGGWRLNPLGIGIENVVKEALQIFNGANVFIMDKDHIKTHRQAVKTRDLFYKTPGAICVGTEMALSYLNQKIENTVVVSLDSYFSIPDFQINEKIFHILLGLREISEKHFLIQTRQENTKIFDYAIRGNLIDFYRDEIEDRKSIGYPPFTTYIKITLEGQRSAVKKQMENLTETMKPYELSVFDAWNPGGLSKFTMHGLISLPREKWVDSVLLQKLRALPPYAIIKVDPVTLL